MATTFDVIYLGVQADFDTVNGDYIAENGSALEGLTIGSAGDPLFSRVQSFSPGSTGYSGGANANLYDPNATVDTFRIDGGPDQTHDMTMGYNATVTYADGTTATGQFSVFQDHDGNTYLAPETSYNADQVVLEAKPIASITFGTAVYGSGGQGWGLTADRYDADFAGPASVDGTSRDDVMEVGHIDADGDQIDGADGDDDTIYGYGGNDAIDGGAGNDVIAGNDGADTLRGGDGDDTIFAGDPVAPEAAPTMVGYWTFDNSGAPGDDLAATDNGAVLVGDAKVPDASAQLHLDGAGDYAVIADDPAYDLKSATVTLSFTLDSLTALTGLVGKDAVNNATGDFSVWVETGGNVVVRWQDDTTDYFLKSDAGVIDTGTEHKVQVTLDNATGTIQLHVDGTLEDSISAPGVTLDGNVNPWVVGGRSWASTRGTYDKVDNGLDGTINSFAIYDGAYAPEDVADPTRNADLIEGGAGSDVIHGDAGDDTIFGGIGDDDLHGAFGDDEIHGGDGHDTIDMGAGNDIGYGDAGHDTFLFATDWGDDTVHGGSGAGEVMEDAIDFSGSKSAVNVTFKGSGDGVADNGGTSSLTFESIEHVIGSDAGDGIDAAADSAGLILQGAGGDDKIVAGAGDDIIDGGRGADYLEGAAGDDTFIFEDGFGRDTVIGGETGETAGDTIDASAMTENLEVVFSETDAGQLTNATDPVAFREIENVVLGSGDDAVSAEADKDGVGIDAGAGADTIWAGSGDDRVEGGLGDDQISGGAGQDTLDGGADRDTIWGGDGSDEIRGGDGGDFLYGEKGDDVVYGGDGLDVIFGGQGSDTLLGESDDDIFIVEGADISKTEVVGGETGETWGDVLILAGDGSAKPAVNVTYSGNESGAFDDGTNVGTFSEIEQIVTNSGDDTIDASAATAGTNISSGSGNDNITGGDGDDTMDAGAGDDRIAGGRGDDTLTGGFGNDTYVFGDGDGADLITDFDLADDDLDGFTNDQLDLGALTDSDGNPVDISDVTVTDTVGDGSGDAILVFPNGERLTLAGVDPSVLDAVMLRAIGIPCLVAGTLIDTPQGGRLVEQLRPGDLVTTLGGGAAPVAWTAQRRLDAAALAADPGLCPIRIRAGALGNWHDLLVSPQHRIALGTQAEPGGFAPASWLACDGDGRFRVSRRRSAVTYVHLLLPRHAVIRAEGAWVESFYPGPVGLLALDPEARAALFRRFPKLAGIRTKADAKKVYGPLALQLIRRRDLGRFLDGRVRMPPGGGAARPLAAHRRAEPQDRPRL